MVLVYPCRSDAMPEPDDPTTRRHPAEAPLIVDLDGTLVATDTLHESLLEIAGRQARSAARRARVRCARPGGFQGGGRPRRSSLTPAALPFRDAGAGADPRSQERTGPAGRARQRQPRLDRRRGRGAPGPVRRGHRDDRDRHNRKGVGQARSDPRRC